MCKTKPGQRNYLYLLQNVINLPGFEMTKYVLTVFWAFQIQADLEQYGCFIEKPLLSYRTSKNDHVILGITKNLEFTTGLLATI